MNWDAIGAMGEVAGAIAVVVTLIYLASQLRQNTKAMRSSTYQTYSALAMNISDYLAEHAEMFERIADGREVSVADSIRYDMWAVKLFYQMETIFLHYKEGTVDSSIFESRMRGFRLVFKDSPLMLDSWNRYKVLDLSDEFVAYAEGNVLSAA